MKPCVCPRDRSVPRTKRTSDGSCSNTGLVTKSSVHEKAASTSSCARMEANGLGCNYSMSTTSNTKSSSGCKFDKDKGAIESPSPDERSILPKHQIGSSGPKRFSRNGNSTKGYGVHQALTPELRRRLSERYLCGDKSFEENPAALSSPNRHECVESRLADLCNASNALVTSLESRTTDACPVKRKSTSRSENARDPNENGKRQRVCDDAEETNKAEAPNKTIDLNDTLSSFLNGPLPRSICRGRHASFKIIESRGKRRSRGMKRSREVAKRRVLGRPAAKKGTTITSDVRCDINTANYEHGDETHIISQPKIVSTFSLADVAVKSRDGEHALNDVNQPSKRKHFGDVINAEKPVQRGLLKNTKSSLCGSYALDYKSLPQLVSVLSAPMAQVLSNLKT